ncbi:MAG: glycosyl hydrolase [Terrimicrobiaceae bacterium]|nr:glycosyl hydrolase [Terrimicrobiaceae bacterium]
MLAAAAGLLFAAHAFALSPLEPATGCYLGISAPTPDLLTVDWKTALGLEPATYAIFCEFPLNGGDETDLDALVKRNNLIGAITLITLEPSGGLDTVTQAACDTFAARCALYEGTGAKLMIRFAHEMNGFWYSWGQNPAAYVAKYQMLATAIHAATKQTAMVWAPNNGLGYPYKSYASVPFPELDTNSDGQFNTLDDPYSPYYPGDAYVDWVGMSVYHWGGNQNVVPTDQEFTNLLTGYNGAAPNFYTRYCSDLVHHKPLIVPESSALYLAGAPGADTNLAIKQGWWQQLFNTSGQTTSALDISLSFPMLKMIVWFDYKKLESTVPGTTEVDWRLNGTGVEPIATAFSQFIETQRAAKAWLLGLSDFTAASYFINLANVPASIPATGAFAVPLTVSSPTDADLIVNILEKDALGNFNFVGGTPRATPAFVAAGTQNHAIAISASALTSLVIGGTYYWQAFLLPPGAAWPNIYGATPQIKVGAVVAATTVDANAAAYAAKLKKIQKAMKKAKKIADPVARARALKKLKAQLKALKKKYGK